MINRLQSSNNSAMTSELQTSASVSPRYNLTVGKSQTSTSLDLTRKKSATAAATVSSASKVSYLPDFFVIFAYFVAV